MARQHKAKPTLYQEAFIKTALEEVDGSAFMRTTAAEIQVPSSKPNRRHPHSKGQLQIGAQEGKLRLPAETEEKLATYIRHMAELGFQPTVCKMKDIVFNYLKANNLEYLFSNKPPSKTWALNFMKRHKLYLKKTGLMQGGQKNASFKSDPFLIYGFYSMIQKKVEQLDIAKRPECIWNLVQCGFPSHPSTWEIVEAACGKTVKVSCESNKESINVLAVCCANGSALDPFIVFRHKHSMSDWSGDDLPPRTCYALSDIDSDTEWLTTSLFHDWFEMFAKETRETRPLLLIFNGYLTHLSTATLELAMKENITVLRPPVHCTHFLLPLKATYFKPLNSYYERELKARVLQKDPPEPLSKAAFANLISDILREGLIEGNIRSGFHVMGLYPVDASKYNIERLDQAKLASYNEWVAAGKPISDDGSPFITHLQREEHDQKPTNLQLLMTTACEPRPSTCGTPHTPWKDEPQSTQQHLNLSSASTSSHTTHLDNTTSLLDRALQGPEPPSEIKHEIDVVKHEVETTSEDQ